MLVAAFTLALGFAAFSRIQGQTKPQRDRKIEDAILRLERETMEAIKNKDAATLSRILADHFVLRSPAGADLNKTEFLKLAQSIPVKILSVKGENLKVNVYGQTAVLTGVQRSTTLGDDGREDVSAGAFTDIFIKRQGRWLLVLAYNVDLPAPPPSRPSMPSGK
jgi:ketosteroid isomerase-like protein